MGVFGPVVQAFVGSMFDAWHYIALCRSVRSQLVSDHHARCAALTFQNLSHQPLCGPGVATALNQDVQNETILIDSAPKPMLLTSDSYDDLIEVPYVDGPLPARTL